METNHSSTPAGFVTEISRKDLEQFGLADVSQEDLHQIARLFKHTLQEDYFYSILKLAVQEFLVEEYHELWSE